MKAQRRVKDLVTVRESLKCDGIAWCAC